MIRLVTVIGHGVELLPHFIEHYQNKVDKICLVVYETEKYPILTNQVKKIIENNDKVDIVKIHEDRIFDWERVTMLYNYIKFKNPNDWWVVADIDEFHLYPLSIKTIIEDCDRNGWDVVRGGFIDRIGRGGEFTKLVEDKSIWEQFPNAGFFRHPMSGANPNKICIMKGYIELTNGQHYAKIDGHTTWRWQGWNHPLINPHHTVQVHHFKWDESSIERVRAVWDIKQEYAYSSEYGEMYKVLLKNKFKIDILNPDYMFELGLIQPEYQRYKQWNKLINKIISI